MNHSLFAVLEPLQRVIQPKVYSDWMKYVSFSAPVEH